MSPASRNISFIIIIVFVVVLASHTNLPLFTDYKIIHLMIYMHIIIISFYPSLPCARTRSFEESTCYHYLNEKNFIHTLLSFRTGEHTYDFIFTIPSII